MIYKTHPSSAKNVKIEKFSKGSKINHLTIFLIKMQLKDCNGLKVNIIQESTSCLKMIICDVFKLTGLTVFYCNIISLDGSLKFVTKQILDQKFLP